MTEEEPPPPSRLQQELVGFIRSFGLLATEQTPCGQPLAPSDAHALTELSAGPMRQRDLVDRLHLDRSSVSRLVDRLVSRGWVERKGSADDRRTVQLNLTPKGHDAAARITESRALRFARLLDAIPAERRDEVVDAIAVLTNAARASNGGSHGH